MEIIGAILAIAATVLPALIKWLERRSEAPTLQEKQEVVYDEMVHVVSADEPDADRLAALWAEHDRMLREEGLHSP